MMMYVVGVFRLLRDKQKRHLELFSLKKRVVSSSSAITYMKNS